MAWVARLRRAGWGKKKRMGLDPKVGLLVRRHADDIENSRPELVTQPRGRNEEDTDQPSGCLVASGSVSSACSAEVGRSQADWIRPEQARPDRIESGRSWYESPLWRDKNEVVTTRGPSKQNQAKRVYMFLMYDVGRYVHVKCACIITI